MKTPEPSTKISTFWKRYRIYPDQWAGYEVRVWRIWWPFWVLMGFANTFETAEKAEAYAIKQVTGVKDL